MRQLLLCVALYNLSLLTKYILTFRIIQVATFFILAFASPKNVKEEATPTTTMNRALRRNSYSYIYDAFIKSISSSLGLHARIYTGFILMSESDRDCFLFAPLMTRDSDMRSACFT